MSLEQRSRLSGIGRDPQPTPSNEPVRRVSRRHCWVSGPPADPGPWPGLVLSWQRAADGWQAWVVYLVGRGADEVVVQGWVERARLAPAD
jgi:hypothetical protein